MRKRLFKIILRYTLHMISSVVLATLATLTVSTQQLVHGSMPRGAQRVLMLGVMLHADCSADVPVEELRLVRRGLGFSSDILGVYAEENGRRVSQATVPARDGTLTLRLEKFTVSACKTTSLQILMDVSSTAEAGGEHRLGLSTVAAVLAPSATVLVQPQTRTALQPVRTAALGTGIVEVEYPRILKRVTYGKDRTILRLRLSVSGERDLQMTRLVLTNDGSARDGDLQNIVLHDNRGRPVSPVALRLHGDRVDLFFDPPVLLPRNASKVLELHADVLASRRRTIRFLVEEPADITAHEARRSR